MYQMFWHRHVLTLTYVNDAFERFFGNGISKMAKDVTVFF